MSTGLIALLDDVVALAKVAAASLDDVALQAGKAGAKAAGVVIDDAAVTPRYVVGFAASREIPIVKRIALGSLKNKLLILLPVALALSLLAPWAITPLLMLGGAFLCYEGAEKVLEAIRPHAAHAHEAAVGAAPADPLALEEARVAGAIKTDFILSAEIMAIALSTIPDSGFVAQAAILAVVGIGITIVVYGAVALIVKADDAGVALAREQGVALRLPAGLRPLARAVGRGLVKGMPPFLMLLSIVGTAAMVWVGGGILVHGLEEFGLAGPAHWSHDLAAAAGTMPGIGGALGWLAGAAFAGVVGLAAGFLLIPVVERVLAPLAKRLRPA
ncbi:MAG: DUF808 domain-containing protein [Roseomonas sp.]|nr:DUF808 domain-containing protein [Roseomonas sp.]